VRCSTVEQRPQVFLAMLRGGSLWLAPGDLAGRELVTWMVEEQTEILFNRWLAEDAVFGHLAIPTLYATDRERSLVRAPIWMAPGRPDEESASEALIDRNVLDLQWLYGLAVRLGSSATNDGVQAAWEKRFPASIRPVVRLAVNMGRARPTAASEAFRPTAAQLTAAPRRWPIELLDGDGVVVCGMCGEGLPAEGACRWCGTDPDEEPAVVVSLEDMFYARPCCPRCEIDLTVAADPTLCPSCGVELPFA